MKHVRTIFMVVFLIAALLACQPVGSSTQIPQPQNTATQPDLPETTPQSSITQDASPTSDSEATEMSPSITPNASTENLVTLVKQHLAGQLGISREQIIVSEIKPVVWRDAGLGCPKPGVDYIQMETPGYQIVLEAQGQTYNYHTDESQRFVPCRS